jgi:hypothetical protein
MKDKEVVESRSNRKRGERQWDMKVTRGKPPASRVWPRADWKGGWIILHHHPLWALLPIMGPEDP